MSEWMLSVYKSLVPRFAARRVAYDTVRLESEIGEQNKSADPSPLGSWFLGRLYRRWTLQAEAGESVQQTLVLGPSFVYYTQALT
jgi:hypothetical protein